MEELFELLAKSVAADEEFNARNMEKSDSPALTFKRDENGVLWSYDAAGNKVGRIFEHGDNQFDLVDEV